MRQANQPLQPTGRGAASSSWKLFEPRPAAEGQVVRQFSVATLVAASAVLLGCLAVACTGAAETSELAVVSSTAVQRSAAISTISLFSYGSGDRATEWEQQRITISSTLTRVERASGFMPAAITEGRTSAREWARLCELVAQSGFFLAPGEQELVSGSHAGDVEVTVSFVDGSTSTVAHRAFYTVGSSPFWTLVRVIEGSSLNALPLSEPPEPSR